MPVINGINMQYNSGVGDADNVNSAAATVILRNAFTRSLASPGDKGTADQVAREYGLSGAKLPGRDDSGAI